MIGLDRFRTNVSPGGQQRQAAGDQGFPSEVENTVQIEFDKQRTNATALNRCNRRSVLLPVLCFQMSIELLLERVLVLLANGPVTGAARLERNAEARSTSRFHRNIAEPLGNTEGRLH